MGPKQIVQPQGTCFNALSRGTESEREDSLSYHPSPSSLPLFHEQLMNADGALGDAVVLLQG